MEPNKLFTILINQDFQPPLNQKFPDNQPYTIACCKLNKTEQCENVVEMTFQGSFEDTKDHGIFIEPRQ